MEIQTLQLLSGIASHYFKQMFDAEIVLDEQNPFEMSPKPNFKTEIIAYIGLAGEEHQGQLVMGYSFLFPQKITEKFIESIPEEEKDEFCNSAICEMLNNLGGIFARSPETKKLYPELSQTLPVINDNRQGTVYFMRSDGGNVKFRYKDEELFFYLSLKGFFSTQIKNDQDSSLLL